MDRHYLNPMFSPKAVVAFAGDLETPAPTREAQCLREALDSGTFKGQVTWLDVSMTGTLADLAQSRPIWPWPGWPGRPSSRAGCS